MPPDPCADADASGRIEIPHLRGDSTLVSVRYAGLEFSDYAPITEPLTANVVDPRSD